MGEEENCMRITRASKKRAFGTAISSTPNLTPQHSPPIKRVVLGDITNTAAAVTSRNQDLTSTQKFKITPQVKKTIEERAEEIVKPRIDVKSRFDGSQKHADAPLIYHHLRSLEVEENRRPVPNYMEKVQRDITPAMREILVDWLVEVADEYKLVSDTLYLTVNYIDRFLSSHALSRNNLQLLGVSSMLVASKFEEITPPHVEDFCYMTDNTYTREEVLNMELDLLKFLSYEMGNPTTRTFIRIFTNAAQDNPTFSNFQFEFLVCYIAELSLLDYTCVRFLPSMIAASATFLARITIQPSARPWTLALQQFTGYASHQLKDCVLAIYHLQSSRKETSGRAIREKYMDHKFKSVAALSPPSEIPHHYFV